MLIDAFLFNGEYDLLDLRLAELSPVVDQFICVESLEYHGSHGKKHRVPASRGKFHHIILDHLEPAFDGTNSWARENYHRNCLKPHIIEVANSTMDIVMLSDCDEIPRAEAVTEWDYRSNELYALGQDFFYYNVNTYGGEWHGTVIGTIDAFYHAGGLQKAREMRDGLPVIPNCGWHLSFFGGLQRIREKTRNYAHAHEDICKLLECRSDEEIQDDIRNMRDLYHRDMIFTRRESDDPRLPKYFLENKERFASWMT